MSKKLSIKLRLSIGLFLSIGAVSTAWAQHDMRIDQIRPAMVAPGDTMEIAGENLGNPHQAKVVFISRLVETSANDFVNLAEVRWVDNQCVRVYIPATLPAGDYLVKIENDASERRGRSNLQRVTIGVSGNDQPDIASSTWPSVVIDRATILSKTLELQGKNFGLEQGKRAVTIHQPDGEPYIEQRLEVLSWNDTFIQARLPVALQAGGYFVLVSNDITSGSNSKTVIIPSSREVTLAPGN
jgi:hypothetical protein